jgi:hypothetical protein
MWSVMRKSVMVLAGGSAGASVLRVKIPFPFVVEDQTLPAGEYSVQTVEKDPSMLLIRGEKGITAKALVLTMPVAGTDPAGEKPALTFTRYETQYRLTDVWESRSRGRVIVSS